MKENPAQNHGIHSFISFYKLAFEFDNSDAQRRTHKTEQWDSPKISVDLLFQPLSARSQLNNLGIWMLGYLSMGMSMKAQSAFYYINENGMNEKKGSSKKKSMAW